MGFRSVLEHSNADLTTSEQRLGSILLASPQDCLLLSGAQLAKRGGVHESTVIRFAQKLGYAGYPELRADLAAEVRQMNESATMRWMRAAESYELTSLVQQQIRTLSEVPNHVQQESINAAAKSMLGARRIYVYGQDFARPLVDFMERKLRYMGFDVVGLRFGGQDFSEHILGLRDDDVLLAYAFEGKEQRREASRVLRRVHTEGATSILITDHLNVMLRPSPTHLLAAPRAIENRRTLVVPLVLSYALEYALFHLAPERIGSFLERLAEMRGEASGAEHDPDGRLDDVRSEFPRRGGSTNGT